MHTAYEECPTQRGRLKHSAQCCCSGPDAPPGAKRQDVWPGPPAVLAARCSTEWLRQQRFGATIPLTARARACFAFPP
jgi:hypothetical protein